jgi:hypothetical protein
MLSLAICAPPNESKKIYKGLQVRRMYGPMFKLKIAPNQIIMLISLGEIVQNNQKTVFFMFFFHFVSF